jgi:hypothetical protein
VGATIAAPVAWLLEYDQSLGLPESASETSALFLLGVGVATAAGCLILRGLLLLLGTPSSSAPLV